MKLAPPLKWHGGKQHLARKIVSLMPPSTHYVEPYAGGLAVLLARNPQGCSEVVNDIDGQLSNFWRVIQDSNTFERFRRTVEAIPFSETEWKRHRSEQHGCPVKQAISFFVTCRQSLAGRMNAFAPISRNRTRRGMNEQCSAWMTAVEGLPAVHARLKRVAILNREAIDVIQQQDGPGTLFYIDPPYLPDTRTSKKVYRHEMSQEKHAELLLAVRQAKGQVILSGYPSKLYEAALSGWNRIEVKIPNHAAGGTTKRTMTECLWLNYQNEP